MLEKDNNTWVIIPKWTPLTFIDWLNRKFSKEIIDILSWLNIPIKLEIEVTQEIVSRIMWHSSHFLKNFEKTNSNPDCEPSLVASKDYYISLEWEELILKSL